MSNLRHGTSVATERELAATRRPLVTYPQALNALLQTARALRRTPDCLSVGIPVRRQGHGARILRANS